MHQAKYIYIHTHKNITTENSPEIFFFFSKTKIEKRGVVLGERRKTRARGARVLYKS